MTDITSNQKTRNSQEALKAVFPGARYVHLENIADLDRATHFEIRPVFDGSPYTFTTYLYGGDTNRVQIRMGCHGTPTELIAIYNGEDMEEACDAFFALGTYNQSLWYDGNDLCTQVFDKIDLIQKIAAVTSAPLHGEIGVYSLEIGRDELYELLFNTGLDDEEQAEVLLPFEPIAVDVN